MCNQTWRISRHRSYLDQKNGEGTWKVEERVGLKRGEDYDFYFLGFEFELKGVRIEREEKDKVEGSPRDARKTARASGSNFRTWNSKACTSPNQTTKPIFQLNFLSCNYHPFIIPFKSFKISSIFISN